VEGLGYLLNNEMDDFSAAPGRPNQFGLVEGAANAAAPRKRMLSSMSPTIVVSQGAPLLVLGSPGGPRIPTSVVQVILNFLVHGMDLESAVAVPRVHHQWLPDLLRLEEGAASPATVAALEEMGYTPKPMRRIGAVMAASLDPLTGEVSGAADPRRYGAAREVTVRRAAAEGKR
jgi:gamma-glutamyltranspeptidase/glutathione hydrolase